MKNNQSVEFPLFITKLKNNLWIFGIHSWLFGITDRSMASLADGYLSAIELVHLFIASFFFVSWLSLKPNKSLNSGGLKTLQRYRTDSYAYLPEGYLCTAQARMLELQEQHMISQEYILPFSYICQIYHLLNLKHLETIHNFSLNNLKVIGVSDFQPTAIGGLIKFQTILDSPVNALRIWRQPIVEVGLILHNPYTVELCIPVYNNKYIIVIFNALPLSNTEHKLFIDIYSNLEWPKPLLQILLHFASCLTLFEDLPYLRKLGERNVERLVHLSRVSNHESMWLFRRFVELYGSSIEPSQLIKVIEEEAIALPSNEQHLSVIPTSPVSSGI
jgi:hypothetical protein